MRTLEVGLLLGASMALACSSSKTSSADSANAIVQAEPAPSPEASPQQPVASDPLAHCNSEKDEEGELTVNENFSGIRLGSSAGDVQSLFGTPESVSEPEEEAATGDIIWNWAYPAQGVSLTMASATQDAKTSRVSWITIEQPSAIKTALGLGIGSPLEDVRTLYRACMSDPDAVPSMASPSIVIGSPYNGLWIEVADGKVRSMALGGAE
tara:strand:- start:68442 stop:69071 length:630 start_codon:yes stop_codon:yes gene_type:complete